jgi:hypothetical protein
MNIEEIRIVMKYSDKILNIIDNNLQDELSRGDLQGMCEAIIMGAVQEERAL